MLIASSQALPALKVALDDECSGKGLAFTKNSPPDFGLLFLAQFARFSIRTETEVTVHTHSQTNRYLHLCPARSGLWKFGFVGPSLASNARWAGSISDQASGPAAEPASKLWMSSLVLTFTKSKPSTARSATHFSMSAHHKFLRRVLSCSLIAMCKPVSKTVFFRPTGEWEKRRQRHGSVQPQTSWISSGLACFFFHSPNLRNRWGWSLLSDCSNFEAEKTSALCTLNFYDVQCTPAKRRSPWGNPKNRGKPQESANQRARYF